ncbi:hypothetical protein PACTADRAFT_82320 [Pachysolen tannophilus NRRL Y-2460]|uniref:Uncharacterized protein n=1 Tax=Pachysolen tannophilus NRRL Y-2460 TaxID=669874 RepID=A0A1E4TPY8_PACTA|nr:hypothetical protein PACTADRAFT_82320 [Pachysolen tannophilus NRRL Y-2460]
MINLMEIFEMQSSAENSILQNELIRSVEIYNRLLQKFDMIIADGELDEDIIGSVKLLKKQAEIRINDLNIVIQEKKTNAVPKLRKDSKNINSDEVSGDFGFTARAGVSDGIRDGSNLSVLRQILSKLKKQNNGIEIKTANEQKLMAEINSLYKILNEYDLKFSRDQKEIENLKKELKDVNAVNTSLNNQVQKLNNRWNELVESAKRRKEKEAQK